jgi:hypothetical protein
MTTPTVTSATCEIRLRGRLDGRWAERLGISDLIHDPDGTTLLSGIAADQALLHGVLQRIRGLGLPPISVQRTDP